MGVGRGMSRAVSVCSARASGVAPTCLLDEVSALPAANCCTLSEERGSNVLGSIPRLLGSTILESRLRVRGGFRDGIGGASSGMIAAFGSLTIRTCGGKRRQGWRAERDGN